MSSQKPSQLLIPLIDLDEFGSQLHGELDSTVFDLKPEEGKPTTGLQYDFFVQRFDEELLLQGKVSATFELECVRTLHPFTKTIEVKNLTLSLKIEEEAVDATESIREEILILLPVYPVCEMGDEKMSCKIEEKYLALDKGDKVDLEDPPEKSGDDRWSALDELDNL